MKHSILWAAATAMLILLILLFLAPAVSAHPFWEKPYYFVERTYNTEKQRVDWQIVEEGGIHGGHEEGSDERNWRFTFKTRAEAEAKGREIDAENARIKKEGKNPLENAFLNGAINFVTAYSQAGLSGKPGTFEKLVAELIQSASDFLVKLLGLNTLEELVYNQGSKAAYIYGIFPKDRWAANQGLYLRIYSVAWLLMFLPPIWIFMKKALSTVNPGVRSSLKGGLLTYFLSLAMMGAVFPVIHFFFWVNDSIIRWFYDGTVVGFFHDAVPGEGFLGAAIVRLAFISLTLYYNFTYRVRAFVLSLLMILAPVFIFFINFEKTRNITITFSKEILFNIFVQSFHAITLYYFVITLGVSGIWDKIVLLMVFIPLTEILRRMIMGPGTATGHLAALAGMATISSMAGMMRGGAKGFNRSSGMPSSGGSEPERTEDEPAFPAAGICKTAGMQSIGGWFHRGFKSAAAGGACTAGTGNSAPGTLNQPRRTTNSTFNTAATTIADAGAGCLDAQNVSSNAQNQRSNRRVKKEHSTVDDHEVIK